MQAHHTLMVKLSEDGKEVVDHKEIPNNEWARYRRTGWEFATPEMVVDYNAMRVAKAEAANEAAKNRAAEETDSGEGPLAERKSTRKKRE